MANSITAYDPTIWSKQGIAILHEKIALPKLVRLDFQNDLAQMGDVVNTRKPGTMTISDVDTDAGNTAAVSGADINGGLGVQNLSATNVAVTLNNHKHATFKIKDREASRSVANLMNEYMEPAMLAVANQLDKSLLALYPDASYGVDLTSANDWRLKVVKARTRLNKNKSPEPNRVLIVSDDDEEAILNLDTITKTNESGSDAALRDGYIRRLRGFDVYRSSNVINAGSPNVRHNLAMHRDAMALVTRVLGTATGRTAGAEQQVATDPDAGLSLRVTISYQHLFFATMISVDLLYGVKTLDSQLLVSMKASF